MIIDKNLSMFDQFKTFLLGVNMLREKEGDGNNLTNLTVEIDFIK